MSFWLISAVILILAAAVLAWPVIQSGANPKGLGMMLVVVFPVAGLMLYDTVGMPEALDMRPPPQEQNGAHASGPGDEMNELLLSLEQRLQQNPDDIDGWMLLGRTYKSMQRYITAEAALRRAAELAPDNALVKVELAEAMLYASGQAEISADARSVLEEAIAIDPMIQKGLWLLGMAEAQSGNDARAIELWERLMPQLDPASAIANSLTEQLAQARARQGQPASPSVPVVTGVPVEVSLGSESGGLDTSRAVLFIFAHPVGASGMPLAVQRIQAPRFPFKLTLGDADTLGQASLSDHEQLSISARLSLSGTANAGSGDINATAELFTTGGENIVRLVLDKPVP
jgi:cytochrome c-type biogenesis protein CcmH